MNILELQLLTDNLEIQQKFYANVLGLQILERTANHLTLQIGSSLLKFTQQPGFTGQYHFAFNIPENQLEMAKTWLESRAELIADTDGTIVFDSQNWNAHQVYFRDPQGNILELIARHELANASQAEFSRRSFLNISEIGLACDDVPSLVQWLEKHLKLEVYKNSNQQFAPVGDANGLLILVQNAREWFPSTGVHAKPQPVNIVIAGHKTQALEIPDLPYQIKTTIPNQEAS